MILIAASQLDPAGVNIASSLIEHFDFDSIGKDRYSYGKCDAELTIIPDRIIYADYLERKYDDVEAIFFITRHVSKEGVASLTTHTPGNFNEALFGGKENTLCISNPGAQKLALQKMKEERDANEMDYQVTLEATHHGPLSSVPSTFFEIGSSEKYWNDKDAGHVIAKSVIAALDYPSKKYDVAIGVGGGHYPEKLTSIVLTTQWAIGHIIPRYAFPIDESMIDQTLAKNNGGTTAIFDWKGTPKRSYYKEIFESKGLTVLKTALL